jgi:putative peptidoglycan lipid II flippase
MTTGKFIFKATLLIAFFNLMSRLLGLLRDVVIAHQFGAGDFIDAYQMALKTPNMLFAIVSGALVTVVVPVYTEYAARGEKKEAWKIFNTVLILVTLFFLAASILGIAGAPLLIKLVAPGFQGAVQTLTVELVRIVLPLMIFAGLASLFTNLLNANNIFGLPAFSTSVNNIFIIISALTLGSRYGIQGLALGTVLAMAAMALVQFPTLLRSGFKFRLALDLRHPGVQKVYILALPAAIGVAVNQANVYINGVLASWLPEGSISALSYADRLIQFPVSLFVLALGTAVFPTLSGWAARGDREDLGKILTTSMKVVIAGIIPASAGLMVLSHPIVKLVFERGAFDQAASDMTAAALFFYAVGLLGQASAILLTRGFYALQDTRTPVKLGLVIVAVNLILSLLFIRYLQHAGLALANSLANLTYLVLLLEFLKRKIPCLREGGLFKFTLIILISAGTMAAASYAVNGALAARVQGFAGLLLQVGLAITAGILVYAGALFALCREDVRRIFRIAREAAPVRRKP